MRETSDASSAPVNVMMRRPTLVGIPALPTLAAPLVVRRAHVAEAGALAALLGQAFPAEIWEAAGTERELFGDETVRATLAVADEARLVATASLQVRPDVPECGWVRLGCDGSGSASGGLGEGPGDRCACDGGASRMSGSSSSYADLSVGGDTVVCAVGFRAACDGRFGAPGVGASDQASERRSNGRVRHTFGLP
jgi:hypothetical protein